jgi:two-component system OmpR family sensor kinase
MKSFRTALAHRIAAQTLVLAAVVVVGAALLLRTVLRASLDASLLEIAEIEAQSGASGATPEFRFRPRGFPTAEQDDTPELTLWGQLLSRDGQPGARSANLSAPLPVPANALRAAQGGVVGYATLAWNGETIRTAIFPMVRVSPLHQGHLLQVAASLHATAAAVRVFVGQMALLGLLGTALAWFLAWQIAGRALQPALAITAEAESIGINELSRRVTTPDELIEFNRMAVAFNALLERIDRAVTGTRRFTSDASHELRAPLTVLRGELELSLSRPRSTGDYEDVLRRCLDEVLRLVRLADDLLMLTRVEGGVIGGKRVPVDLDDVAGLALSKKTVLAAGRGVSLTLDGSAGIVQGDSDLVQRAVDNLLEHAIMASPRGGVVRIRLVEGERRIVEITDSGPGLKEDEISGVFQRFYRSNRPRSASEESGLGLPIARAVALSHGGSVEYAGNDPGACFRLTLPAS